MTERNPKLPGWPRAMNKELASAYLGISVRALERLVASRQLVPRRSGRRLLFLREELDQFLDLLPAATPGDVVRPGA